MCDDFLNDIDTSGLPEPPEEPHGPDFSAFSTQEMVDGLAAWIKAQPHGGIEVVGPIMGTLLQQIRPGSFDMGIIPPPMMPDLPTPPSPLPAGAVSAPFAWPIFDTSLEVRLSEPAQYACTVTIFLRGRPLPVTVSVTGAAEHPFDFEKAVRLVFVSVHTETVYLSNFAFRTEAVEAVHIGDAIPLPALFEAASASEPVSLEPSE